MTTDAPADNATEAQVAAAIARCALGERAALRVIYDIEARRMVGVARRMLRRQDLAEEAVQDAFMRLWRSARTFDPAKGAARSWLYAILRNCALTILRAHRETDTPAIVATDVARPDERLLATTLAELDPETVTMRSLVLIAGETAEWTPVHLIARRG